MKTGALVHGALLAGALVVAYQTWTKEKKEEPTTGDVVMWSEDESAFESIHFDAEKKSVGLERRKGDSGNYLWGSVKRTTKVPPPPKPKEEVLPAIPQDEMPKPDEFKVSTREFPVGEKGDELIGLVADMRALRELGPLSDEQKEEYGLSDSKENLSITFAGGKTHSLVIGKRVYGGSHRYASDTSTGKSYVLSADIMRPIDSAESSLGLKKFHNYEEDEVTEAVIETSKETKSALRKEVDDPEKGPQTTWSWSDTPDSADLTIANFLDRADKLKPTKYDPDLDPSSLTKIATIRFKGAAGELGYLEMYRQLPSQQVSDDDKAPKSKRTQYWIKTEETRVLGKASPSAGDRVDQDLVELFGIEPPPKAPKATPPKPPGLPGGPGAGALPGAPGAPKSPPPGVKANPPSKPAATKAPVKPATPKAPAKPVVPKPQVAPSAAPAS